jgi:glycosyltransferase involved in cell wall biosynthesis
LSIPVVGIVVPTLGSRPEFLTECLESIRHAGDAYILVVAPQSADLSHVESLGLFDSRVEDPRTGLPAAINFGIQNLPSTIRYINWLGDDDKLLPGALVDAEKILENDRSASFVYGGCNYIDTKGRIIRTNHSGNWARLLLRVGPDLIPQPGALIRRTAFEKIGTLNTDYGWAFDLEMFIQLGKVGRGRFVRRVLAEFRWHEGSLTVGSRDGSSKEAKSIRKKHLPALLKPCAVLWEFPFQLAGQLVAARLTAASRK